MAWAVAPDKKNETGSAQKRRRERDMTAPSRQKRGLENGVSSSRGKMRWAWEMMDVKVHQDRPSQESRGRIRIVPGTLPGTAPWAGLLALDGLRIGLPVITTVAQFATTNVHHSGASAAEFHRLPVRRI